MKYKKYPSYKDSGIDWLCKIPSEWNITKVKHKFLLGRGRVISLEELEEEGEYPVYSSQTKNNGILGYINSYDFDCKQITWTTDGANAGTVFLREGKHNCTNVCGTLLPIKKNENLEYLTYTLGYATTFYKRPDTNGAKIMNGEMSEIFLTFPPVEEQQQIANFLDKATAKIDTLIEKQTKQIELLKEKRQAVISYAVTKGINPNVPMKDSGVEWLGEIPEHWEVSKLRFLFSFSIGLNITKANLIDEDGIPCVNYGEIHSKYGFEVNANKDSLKYVDKEYLITSKTSLLSEGDFVFADTSEDVKGSGNFTHVVGDSKIFAGYHTVIARLINNYNSRYFAYIFDSNIFRTQIQLSIKGVKVFSITQAILKNCLIWFPVIEEQQQIVNYLDEKTSKIDTLIEKSNKSIELLKEKRTALISAAVTGKIDVREEK
ncbi:restriction endonuclease subunit S [Aliarcobacter butzleri]|uniref:restriction endonuclease subunit S n=1 Tax=Aliarcobacter butzleri TaxID=28197 RepID=UPI0021B6E6F9|nr:restriction endonuclease subunit S [Aliarcobacter butzleri]MCT7622415.1 restriction endonuclease subunit S [Aliarcobacter butzleri]